MATVVYSISCKCENNIYVGDTYKIFDNKMKEHEEKARLTKRDVKDGTINSADQDSNKEKLGKISSQKNPSWEERYFSTFMSTNKTEKQ